MKNNIKNNKSNFLKTAGKIGVGVAFIAVPAVASGQTMGTMLSISRIDRHENKIIFTEDSSAVYRNQIATQTVVSQVADSVKKIKQEKQESVSREVSASEFSQSSVEYHAQSDGNNKSRINIFYNLPLKSDVYFFMEFYGKNGYFGKNMIYTPIPVLKGLGAKIESKHSSSASMEVGFGLEERMNLPGGIFASVKALPLVLGKKIPASIDGLQDREGHIKSRAVVGYVASKTFNITDDLDVNLSAFGDAIFDSKKGMLWDYGEIDAVAQIKTAVGQFDFGAGFNQNVVGKALPDTKFRVRAAYHPKTKYNQKKGYHVKK